MSKEILFLGSGDFSGPVKYANKLRKENTNFKLIATELATHEELAKRYTYVRKHEGWEHKAYDLEKLQEKLYEEEDSEEKTIRNTAFENWQALEAFEDGDSGSIALGLDVNTMHKYVPKESFDHIVFENPHSGDYGSEMEPIKYHLAVSSNRYLLTTIFAQAARALRKGGTFELTVCGWPYVSNTLKDDVHSGMKLDSFAGAFGFGNAASLQYVGKETISNMKVSRNNGEFFQADGIKLTYKKPA